MNKLEKSVPIRKWFIEQWGDLMNMEVLWTETKEIHEDKLTEDIIAIVWQLITENFILSVRRNESGLTKTKFHKEF